MYDIESADVQRKVLDGLKSGSEVSQSLTWDNPISQITLVFPHLQALKAANAMFSIEEIESIMDDTVEAVEKQREIDALLSGQGRYLDYYCLEFSE